MGHRDKYIGDNDQLILEDEVQRIKLVDPKDGSSNHIGSKRFCTGLVIALLGYEDDNSNFVVSDYCFKETSYPGALSPLSEQKYVVLLSGIELGAESNTNLFKIQMRFIQ